MKRLSIGCRLFLLAFATCWAAAAPALQGAELQLLLQVHMEDAPHEDPKLVMARALSVLRNRLHHLNLDGAFVTAQPGQRIAVRLPSVADPERVRRLLQKRALLEFRLVDFPSLFGSPPSREEILQHYHGQLPAEVELLEQHLSAKPNQPAQTCYYAVTRKSVVNGDDFLRTQSITDANLMPALDFNLKPEPAEVFKKVTADSVGRYLAIVLDGRILAAPVIQSRIDGHGMINGNFTQGEVDDLASILGTGALPVRLTVVEGAGGKKPS